MRVYPCATGLHHGHTSKAATEVCAEYAARLRQLERDEEGLGAEASFDSEGDEEDDG